MRAKSEIISTLSASLTSDIWKKLKNALLGREMIAFGAEVISENENIKDAMLQQLNPETADKNGLYLLSQMNEIPITNTKPNALVVQMASNSKTYAPFELVYNIGNNTFTNIEYTMRDKSVALINGTYKCYPHNMSNISGAIVDGEEVSMYDNNTSYYCIKIGNAYPDSIIVTDEYNVEIPRYSTDTAMSNTIDTMYKVFTGVDGNQYIRFICAEGVESPTAYRIVWLDHSSTEVDYDDSNILVKENNVIVAEIKYLSRGSVDNIDYMREQLKKELAKYNGLNTPKSIERYVNGFPYVIDSKCVADNNNGLIVYVKPSENKDLTMYLDFSEIAAHISLNSILFPKIKVTTGKKINFGLQINGVTNATMQNNIKALVQDVFSYDNMKFNSVINTSQVLNEIYGNFKIVPSIKMNIREDFTNNESMSYVPAKNTLKGYSNEGLLVAWENNDILYGNNLNANPIPFLIFDVVCSIGKMFLLKQQVRIDNLTIEEQADDFVKLAGASYKLNSSKVTYPALGTYNIFYLYDVSTNMIKPFDTSLYNMLMLDDNPTMLQSAWNEGNTKFANLLDVEVLSTNNGLILNFIYKDSSCKPTSVITSSDLDDIEEETGEELTQEQKDFLLGTGNVFNWNNDNKSSWGYFLRGNNASAENNPNYRGKYQAFYWIKQSSALMDLGAEGWNFDYCADGHHEWVEGFYSGMKGYDNRGNKLNIKANGFAYENGMYYVTTITNSYIVVKNIRGSQKISIPLNGEFKGMIEREGVLYVIQERCITVVDGFSGLKQNCKIYNTFKDLTTPLVIDDIANGFNKNIIIKSKQNIYIAEGFTLLTDSKITFSKLQQVFVDVDTSDCEIGSVTNDYATCFKKVKGDNQSSYIFYCYDKSNDKTFNYSTSATFEDINSGSGGNSGGDNPQTQRKEWWAYGKSTSSYSKEYRNGNVFNREFVINDVSVSDGNKFVYDCTNRVSKYTSSVRIDDSKRITSEFPLNSGETLENLSDARKAEYEDWLDSMALQYGIV